MSQDLSKIAKQKNIKYFLISYVDFFGVLRSKLVPSQVIKDMQKEGAGFAGFSTYLDMSPSDPDMTDNFKRPIDPETYSSGRLNDWKKILTKIDGSIFYGYGAQGDRFLINQTASNGLLYSLSSSGILGTIAFIFFSIFSGTFVKLYTNRLVTFLTLFS